MPTVAFWSVPWFFLCSGLFFVDSFDRHGFWGGLRRKSYSLLLPYVLWCALGAVILAAPVWDLGFWPSIVQMFALRETHPVWNGALWYLRTLIVFSVLGCVALLLVDRIRAKGDAVRLVVYAIVFCVFERALRFSGVLLGPGSSSAYFLLGSLLAPILRQKNSLGAFLANHARAVAALALFGSVLCRLVWFGMGFTYSNSLSSGLPGHLLNNLSVALFIGGIWYVGDLLPKDINCRIVTLCSVTSFVYFSHQPILQHISRLTLSIWGPSNTAYIANIVIAILLFPTLALIAKKTPFYRILSGGR